MKRTVKKALKNRAWVMMSVALLSCSAESPVRTAQYATQGLYSADLSHDGAYALVGSIQHGGSYWKTSVNERRFSWNHAQGEFSSFNSVDIAPSGEFAVTAEARTLVLWRTVNGQSDGYWTTPGDILSVKLTQNGDYALLGLDDQTARYFDVKRGGIRQTLRTGAKVRAVDVTADGRLGVTGDDLSKVMVWDLQTGQKKFEWTLNNRISTVSISADGKYAFASAQLGNAKVWSLVNGRELTSIDTGKLKYRNVTISKAIFSDDNRQLLTGEVNGKVTLLQVSTGQMLQEWQVHKGKKRPSGASVIALSFGLSNRYYAMGSNGYLNVLE
ncbi:WD40 repeat domain-containing protein [Marinomonas aquiplantarum]|uniref:WD-40 repeat-containing protein n=1 Tax=Marinomonas aquiplantarum TaxID=491951 RepID=A0A366D6Y7_9GAMM|nr:hypothetical protein [Marinomonas aquiplantarum]RBO85797.1 WD-40 repeat-containing protein [Marinomonas aquiplantarum]